MNAFCKCIDNVGTTCIKCVTKFKRSITIRRYSPAHRNQKLFRIQKLSKMGDENIRNSEYVLAFVGERGKKRRREKNTREAMRKERSENYIYICPHFAANGGNWIYCYPHCLIGPLTETIRVCVQIRWLKSNEETFSFKNVRL